MAGGTGPVLVADDEDVDEFIDDFGDDGAEGAVDVALPFDISRFQSAALIEAFPLDGCKVTGRGGKVTRPFRGQSVWLLPYTPDGLESSFVALGAYVAQIEHGGEDGGLPEGDIGKLFADVKRGLSRVVAGWDALDPNTGLPLAQPYNNAAVWSDVPTALLYYILGIVRTGEAPDDRPNARTPGLAGGGTAKPTARTTRTTTTGQRRR